LLAKRKTLGLEHARDQLVEREERVARIVTHALFEVAPLALPLVSVESGFLHRSPIVPERGAARNPE